MKFKGISELNDNNIELVITNNGVFFIIYDDGQYALMGLNCNVETGWYKNINDLFSCNNIQVYKTYKTDNVILSLKED